MQFVDQILPPLSEWDEVKLNVALPLLAATLKSSNQVWSKLESQTSDMLKTMITYLAQFSLSSDHVANSRSAATTCLFAILLNSGEPDEIQTLFEEAVASELTNAMSLLKNEVSDGLTPRASGSLTIESSGETLQSTFSRVNDILSFMSVLVSDTSRLNAVCMNEIIFILCVLPSLGFSCSMQRRPILSNWGQDCIVLHRARMQWNCTTSL